MPRVDQVGRVPSAAPLPLLLLVVSPAALEEASTLGGSIFIQKLAENLLEQLGGCSPDDGAKQSLPAQPSGVQTLSWRCHLQTKYYTANIRAILVQQQGLKQTQEPELLLQEPPQAVVFICSRDEQDQLNEARRSITRAHSQTEYERTEVIEPLPFMRESYVVERKQDQEQESQLEGEMGAGSNGSYEWWVRSVPLKFIISIHCNTRNRRSCCNKSKADSSFDNCRSSLIHNGCVDTTVWNICGDVFLEGLEVCFVDETSRRSGATPGPEDADVFASSAVAHECLRLRRIAEALHCHMWPGLSRFDKEGDGNFRSGHTATIKRAGEESNGSCEEAGYATNLNEDSSHHQPHEGRQHSKESGRQGQEVNSSHCTAADTDAFDNLAAAMLDLKQRGPAISSEDRRRTALRLATQLAALTMCDEEQ